MDEMSGENSCVIHPSNLLRCGSRLKFITERHNLRVRVMSDRVSPWPGLLIVECLRVRLRV